MQDENKDRNPEMDEVKYDAAKSTDFKVLKEKPPNYAWELTTGGHNGTKNWEQGNQIA